MTNVESELSFTGLEQSLALLLNSRQNKVLLLQLIIYSTKFKALHWSITSAKKRVIVEIEVIECNTKVAMETIGEARNLNTKSKMDEKPVCFVRRNGF